MLQTQRVYYREPCGFQEKNNAVILRSLYDSEPAALSAFVISPPFMQTVHILLCSCTLQPVCPLHIECVLCLAFKDKLQPTWDLGCGAGEITTISVVISREALFRHWGALQCYKI